MDSDICPADQSPWASLCSASVPVDVVQASGKTVAAPPVSEAEDLDSYNPIEPPPLDWRSDSSSEAGSAEDLDDPSFPPSLDSLDKASPGEQVLLPLDTVAPQELVGVVDEPVQDAEVELDEEDKAAGEEVEVRTEDLEGVEQSQEEVTLHDKECRVSKEGDANRKSGDEDHNRIHSLLSQLQLMGEEPHPSRLTPPHLAKHQFSSLSEPEACVPSLITDDSTETTGRGCSSPRATIETCWGCCSSQRSPHPITPAHPTEERWTL
ncbi:hypothetical protein L3Q82_007935 [Scortum barcoo]|uniref:Uncharacterized protein n=1 Tax=Scortum barcoo TaxID=214431 RepID=A0ACB8WK82_9TELE|nr:hypothetical protein L3Q82_007935 [Scortum barcoo]